MPDLDRSKPFAEVHGEPFGDEHPVAYEQNGHYFDRSGKQVTPPAPKKKDDVKEG